MATSGRHPSSIGHDPRAHVRAFEHAPRPLVGYAHDYAAGHRTGRHDHPRAQLLHALSGVMRVATDDALFSIPPGMGLWMPADVSHAVDMREPVRMRALFLRADAARAGPAHVAAIAVSPLLRQLILAACAEPLDWDRRGRGPHICALALREIAAARQERLSVPAPRDPRLARAVAPLLANPGDPQDLEALADRAGASVRTLMRLFRAETGLSFRAWRQWLRMTEGRARLAAGQPPAHVAAALGYASGPAFGAAFRVAFGTTPGRAARPSQPDATSAAASRLNPV
jgi:AraC-like DNA-binding protein